MILDISIPATSGIDVLERIKNVSQETIVIMLTNYSSEQFRKKCFELHADYFFYKSNEYFDVLNTLITVVTKPCVQRRTYV
ncbi:MAG: response regulator [Bacteroidetes bacterium]|nr:response regulator [Bacteroidota bacterium]